MKRAVWLMMLAWAAVAATAVAQENMAPQTVELSAPATAVAIAPLGKFAATVSADRKLSVWNLDSGQLTKSVALDSSQVDSIALSPEGNLVFVGLHDGRAAVWDVIAGKAVQEWRLQRYASASAFTNDGKVLAFSPGGEPAQVFEVDGFRKRGETVPVPGGIQALAFSRDGKRLATADSDTSIRVYAVSDVKLLSENHDLSMEPLGVDFTADGATVAAAGGDRTVVLVEASSGKLIRRLAKTENPIFFNGLKVSDGDRLGLVFMKAENMSEPAPIAIWSLAAGEKQWERTLPTMALGAEWTTDGKLLCVGGTQNVVQFWRLP